MKKGKLAIEFAITSDGKVARHATRRHFGRCRLDRPAWGSITASNPFPPLLAISPDLTWRCVSGFITTPTKPIWNKLSELGLAVATGLSPSQMNRSVAGADHEQIAAAVGLP